MHMVGIGRCCLRVAYAFKAYKLQAVVTNKTAYS